MRWLWQQQLLLLLLLLQPLADCRKTGSRAKGNAAKSTSVVTCTEMFDRADSAVQLQPVWLEKELAWDMRDAEHGVELYLAALGRHPSECSGQRREQSRSRLHNTLIRMWQTGSRGPGGETVGPRADAVIIFVRNATVSMTDGRVAPPADPKGLKTWASLLEGIVPRRAAELYQTALYRGEPETPLGATFMHGCLVKAGDYAQGTAVLRNALQLEELELAAAEAAADDSKAVAGGRSRIRSRLRILNLRTKLAETLVAAMTPATLHEASEVLLPGLKYDLEASYGLGGGSRNAGRFVDLNLEMATVAYLRAAQKGHRNWSPVGWVANHGRLHHSRAPDYRAMAGHLVSALSTMQQGLVGHTKPGTVLAKAAHMVSMIELTGATKTDACHIDVEVPLEVLPKSAAENGGWQPLDRTRRPLDPIDSWAGADAAIGADAALHRLGAAGLVGCEEPSTARLVGNQLEEYILRNRPAMFRGVLNGWLAADKWRRSELLRRHGKLAADVATVAYPIDFGEGARTISMKDYVETMMVNREHGPDNPPPYVFQSLDSTHPLRADGDLSQLLQLVSMHVACRILDLTDREVC